jgi:hypothetical protein
MDDKSGRALRVSIQRCFVPVWRAGISGLRLLVLRWQRSPRFSLITQNAEQGAEGLGLAAVTPPFVGVKPYTPLENGKKLDMALGAL